MSELGPLTFGKKEEQIFLGREIAQHQDYSEDTALKIDQEVKRIVMLNYERSREILLGHKTTLQKIAEQLLTREVLDAEQVRQIVTGESLGEKAQAAAQPAAAAQDEDEARRRKERSPIIGAVPPLQKPLHAD
jgi:cell division protease FtsH